MKASLLVTAVLAASAADTRADLVAPTRARQLADVGRAAHDLGQYADAIAAFTEAYVLAPTPALLFNLAQSYRLDGRCDVAARMYRRYLGNGADIRARELAEIHLATMERCMRERSRRIVVDDPIDHQRVPVPPLGSVGSPHRSSPSTMKAAGVGALFGGTVAIGIAAYHGLQHDSTTARVFGITGGAAVVTGGALLIIGRRAERVRPLAITRSSSTTRVSYTWRF